MIDADRLQELVRLMVENDLSELDLRDKDQTVSLKRSGTPVASAAPVPPPAPAQAAPAPTPAVTEPDADDGLVAVESPMVGTFYARPKPDAEAFVKVGSPVGEDTVVCLVEAMKVFNEVQAGVSGTIERVLAKDGDAVEFGQRLFLVRPA
ncbi:MAG: acetyl-CoA carboxylase biotin carboxyl carrier protein [Planctomycetota bacterium]|nr:MAG: acetyl-CoA carboxylase biotin carboxyl carrier protein [Planctomycetota bacterium]